MLCFAKVREYVNSGSSDGNTRGARMRRRHSSADNEEAEKLLEKSERIEMLLMGGDEDLLKRSKRLRDRLARAVRSDSGRVLMLHDGNSELLRVKRDQQLGKGSFGKVFRGVFEGRPVAVKELSLKSLEYQQLPAVMAELIRESEVLCELHHEGIVQFLGFATKPAPTIMLELMERGSV